MGVVSQEGFDRGGCLGNLARAPGGMGMPFLFPALSLW